jgi:hypothetical protein
MKHPHSFITRRDFLWMAGASSAGFAQGVSQRKVKALPRGKPSGIPFLAHFTDVAAAAGLTSPVIYGGVWSKNYIFEAVGCGVAFFDYDNDGWLDIFILGGMRVDEHLPDATNRLYKNNRDGTFTDVTAKAGLVRSGWASGLTIGDYNNDGFEDIFITYYGQNVLYRNNGDGTFNDVTKQAGLLYEGSTPEVSDVIQRLPLWSKRRRSGPLILNTSGPSLGHFGDVPSGVSTSHLAMAADFVLTDLLMARTELKLSANHIVPSGASAIETDQPANVPVG